MSMPRRKNDFVRELVVITHAHEQVTAPGFVSVFKPTRKFLVTALRYVNSSGLVEDATNYFLIQVKNDATVVADWSTETGEEGTISSETFVDLTTDPDNLVFDTDETMTLAFVEAGTATLPPGKLQIEGHYL